MKYYMTSHQKEVTITNRMLLKLRLLGYSGMLVGLYSDNHSYNVCKRLHAFISSKEGKLDNEVF